MRELRARVGNALAFQAAWLACVAGAAHGRPWLGPAVVAVTGSAFIAGTRPRARAATLLALAAAAGLIVDGALVASGVLAFTHPAGGPALAAPWMVALWVAFATTLPWSMAWLRGRFVVAAVAGAVSGPLAYWAGARLGAVALGPSLPVALAAVGVAWALALPALVVAEMRLVGAREPEPVAR